MLFMFMLCLDVHRAKLGNFLCSLLTVRALVTRLTHEHFKETTVTRMATHRVRVVVTVDAFDAHGFVQACRSEVDTCLVGRINAA